MAIELYQHFFWCLHVALRWFSIPSHPGSFTSACGKSRVSKAWPTVLHKLPISPLPSVSVFGTSPRYLAELRSRSIVPRELSFHPSSRAMIHVAAGEKFNLSKLRIVTSTGAVLSEDIYNWFYGTGFPLSVQLISMSGGTDIAGCCKTYPRPFRNLC